MSLTLIIILIIAGLLFLLLEVLVIPGTTVVGIAGFALIVFSVWESYHVFGSPTGHFVLIGTIFFTILTIYLALKSKTWNKIMLKTEISGKVNEIDSTKVQAGDPGVTVSRLTPGGKALINNEYYEVHTNGEFIDQESEIIVTHLADNKIFVKRK
ncbi:MAG: NfeD family protein [Lentimicrobium sp.]|jgi:membrane-bound ClpP family serine protease|uniref:NfeD family protein n=1 Tax=Lentimicrobium sp. TaxID=2034841 RepID=UPI0025E4C4F7|nr:NfeD family protein [Lentimicrobium sp.]MCO5256543.1 NfeD family protein [Lentimicrobium sp.]MCO5261381.1 NfeD family protein [Lentimicrobium sp.]HPF63899.1 NfeD family protein [Lentimicrobium sp.]HPJ63164.1 NfeD family protein [Lentimicrobium sp.]HRW68974.1 NfeD family protein [Lentimicrobium sp.]